MGVEIDEARRDDQPARIHDAIRVAFQAAADRRDPAVADTDVADEATAAQTIDDGAAANEHVECRHDVILSGERSVGSPYHGQVSGTTNPGSAFAMALWNAGRAPIFCR